ncbi:hypothetical protein [Paenibacillus sp. HB172176]|uniref:hypothetical protein n=1 Tax=Paenibacillus sp. HB172176 TaxID=2493690 RepID=UPI001439A990|nr:hypothetical protein [Paenibacillus sp. HB172176]
MISNLLYVNVIGLILGGSYLVIGFYYRRSFYSAIPALGQLKPDEWIASLPTAQSYAQKQLLDRMVSSHGLHMQQLQKLIDEKREHQEYILSWIHEMKLPIAAGRLLIVNSEGKSTDYIADRFEDELSEIDHFVEQAMYYSRIDSFASEYLIAEVSLQNSTLSFYNLCYNSTGTIERFARAVG